MIIDTHCHFDMMPQPEAYIQRIEKAGDIVIGMTNLPSHYQMGAAHIAGYKHVRLALGLHPLLAADNKQEITLFEKLVDSTSYIGEIGLDFSKEGYMTKDTQIEVLRKLLGILKGKNKIISVHSRRAERDLFDLLCEYDIKNVIFHWYSGAVSLIPEIIERGYYFSVNEAMTLSRSGQAILKAIPRDRMLTETDAPFNGNSDIKKAIAYLGLSENEVYSNFKCLLNRLRQIQ